MEFKLKVNLFKWIIILILFFSNINAYSYDYHVKNSNYIVSCSTRLIMQEINQKEAYGLVNDDDLLSLHSSDKFIFSVTNGTNKLSFDLTPYMFTDRCSYSYFERIYFYEIDSGFEIFYVHDDLNIFIITFDFEKNAVNFSNPGFLSKIFCTNYSFDFIYNYIFHHKLINSDYSDIQINAYNNDNCDFSGSNLEAYPLLEIKDGYLIAKTKLNLKNGFQSVPQDLYHGTNRIITINLISDAEYRTKSFLTEGVLKYESANLKSFSNLPWCPTIDFDKEEIIIKSPNYAIEGLYFGNGYFNEMKKYLYRQNARVKDIEIEFLDSGFKEYMQLADTGYIQYIPLVDVNSHVIKIRILSVYEGEKYNDVCINCILPLRRIPYEELQSYIGER